MDGRRRNDGQSKFFRLLRLDSAQLFVILARVLLCWDPLRRYLLAPNNPNSLVFWVSFFLFASLQPEPCKHTALDAPFDISNAFQNAKHPA